MNLKELIKKYGTKAGEDEMWHSINAVSEFVDELGDYDKERYCELKKQLYSIMCGKHYDRDLANEQIAKMYYNDERGVIHRAPYWTEEQMKEAYSIVRGSLPQCYNEFDFWVTLNMLKSDYGNLLSTWFPDDADPHIIEMTVSYLNDPDSPHPDSKIWSYFND